MGFAFASSLSIKENSLHAVREIQEETLRWLEGRRPDLAILFVSPHHARELEEAVSLLAASIDAPHLIGCTGQGVIGIAQEVEETPGICLLAASLPGVQIQSVQIDAQETLEGIAFSGLPEIPDKPSTLLLLGEPYSFPAVEFINRLNEDSPGLQVIGGMASGALSPGDNRLFLHHQTLGGGAVGVLLSGSIRIRPVVSQGCKPFGKPAVVTRAENNLIFELGGRPALTRLQEEITTLSGEERDLLRNGLHLGRAIHPAQGTFGRGDFLVRNVIGIDAHQGCIAVNDHVRSGQTVQFHLRDARSASEDLELLLKEACLPSPCRRGALLFSCNGRGSYLFSRPHHDAASVCRELGPIPLAGFFAAGELGPVGGRNFLHGFTASIAIFGEE